MTPPPTQPARRASVKRGKYWHMESTMPIPWITERAAEMCRYLNVPFERLVGTGRHPSVVFARRVITYTLRTWPGQGWQWASYPEIAKSIGYSSHSTVVCQFQDAEKNPDVICAAEEIVRQKGWSKRMSPVLVQAATGQV